MNRTKFDNRIHRVLWTGGLDSTYRMIELALQDVIVEPVYVVNPGRRSREIELAAMQTILGMLRDDGQAPHDEMLRSDCQTSNSSKRFRAEIRDIKIINKEDILPGAAARLSVDDVARTALDNAARFAIHEAYERLHASYDIGPQYEWLAALSKIMPGLEICIEKAPEGRLHSRDAIIAAMIQGTDVQNALSRDENTGVAVGNSSLREDVDTIFGSFILPIFDKTEDDMIADINAWSCEDIIKHIWFCNHPLICDASDVVPIKNINSVENIDSVHAGNEKCRHIPCGICHPCQLKIESGMKQLLPASALGRYQAMKTIEQDQGADAAREYRMKIWIESGIEPL